MYKNKDVLIKNGIYGYYISYDGKNHKFLESMDENMGLEDAVKCIEGNGLGSNSSPDKKIGNYLIKNGQYGFYIIHDKKFYGIPKDYDIDTLTKEMCDIIIKLPKKVYKKK